MPGGYCKIRPEDNPKPFQKGQKGLGGHRKKGVPNTKTRLKRLLSIIQRDVNSLTGNIEDMTVAERLDISMIMKALSGDVKAYDEIMTRAEGKVDYSAPSTVEGEEEEDNGNEFTYRVVTPDEDE